MAWTDLPTNYQDAAWIGSRKFNMINNSDGTVSFSDVTQYTQIDRAYRSAADVNATNDAINTLMGIFEGAYKLLEPTNINIISGNQQAFITWTDPENGIREEDNTMTVQWAGTLVLRKIGAAPNGHNDNDATVIIDEKVRNQYQVSPFTDTGLSNGETYYYGIYPYSSEGKYTDSFVTSVYITGVPVAYNATINVKTKPNASVSAVGGSETITGTANSSGICSLTTNYIDKYNIFATATDWKSVTKQVLIIEGTSSYNVNIEETYVFSWSQVKRDVINGNLTDYNVGDTYNVEVQGDATYQFVLVAKNHDANNQLIFGLKANGLNTLRSFDSNKYYKDNDINIGDSDLYKWLNDSFYYFLPRDLQNAITERTMQVVTAYTDLATITKKIWLPRTYEVTGFGGPSVETNATRINQFEYYRTTPSYIGNSNPNYLVTSADSAYTSGHGYGLRPYYLYRSVSSGSNTWNIVRGNGSGDSCRVWPHFQISAD